MEGLTNEMERSIRLGDYNQDRAGGGEGEEDRKPYNKGKKNKGGGGGGGGNDGYAGGSNGGGMLRTPADIYEHPTSYSFILDMPGVDTQNIKVKVENGVLHVTGKRKKMMKMQGEEGVKAMRLERRRARYMRKFTLPSNAAEAKEEHVKATYKDGVLIVSISKTPTTIALTS